MERARQARRASMARTYAIGAGSVIVAAVVGSFLLDNFSGTPAQSEEPAPYIESEAPPAQPAPAPVEEAPVWADEGDGADGFFTEPDMDVAEDGAMIIPPDDGSGQSAAPSEDGSVAAPVYDRAPAPME